MLKPRGLLATLLMLGAAMLWQGSIDAAHNTPVQTAPPSLAGQLLVATPELQDPNFRHTIVYMVEHNAGGALGLVINRKLGTGPLGKLLAGMGVEEGADIETEIRIHQGGPVARNQGFVLYSVDYRRDETVMFDQLGAQVDQLPEIALEQGTYQGLIAFGYAGWGAQQLEGEIASGSWLTIPPDAALLFDDAIATKWQRALARRGTDL